MFCSSNFTHFSCSFCSVFQQLTCYQLGIQYVWDWWRALLEKFNFTLVSLHASDSFFSGTERGNLIGALPQGHRYYPDRELHNSWISSCFASLLYRDCELYAKLTDTMQTMQRLCLFKEEQSRGCTGGLQAFVIDIFVQQKIVLCSRSL